MKNTDTYNRLLEYLTVSKESDDLYRGLAKGFGMSECSFWILYTLRAEKKSCTQHEICGYLFEPKQTVNSALKKLETDGYIKLSHTRYRRSTHIFLTEKGLCLAEETADKILEAEYFALSGLSAEEQMVFVGLYKKFLKRFKENLPVFSRKEDV